MTLEQANKLFFMIRDAIYKGGGAYKNENWKTEFNIGESLYTRQFVIKIHNGMVKYFACYWMVHAEDIKGLKDRVKPSDRVSGNIMYIADMVNLDDKQGMREIIKKLRRKQPEAKGVMWLRPAKNEKVCYFPSQKGASNG